MGKFDRAFKGLVVMEKDTFKDSNGVIHRIFKLGMKTDATPRVKFDLFQPYYPGTKDGKLIDYLDSLPMMKQEAAPLSKPPVERKPKLMPEAESILAYLLPCAA